MEYCSLCLAILCFQKLIGKMSSNYNFCGRKILVTGAGSGTIWLFSIDVVVVVVMFLEVSINSMIL